MNALCTLCDTNIVAVDEVQLSTLMLAHILKKHSNLPKYRKWIKKMVDLLDEDFNISFDTTKEQSDGGP